MATVYTTIENDMLDAIVYRQYGYVDKALEAVTTANPALREMPEKLPAGVVIVLPEIAEFSAARMKRIWDL